MAVARAVDKYLARYAATQIALPIGVTNFAELIREDRYAQLRGGLLEVFGRLFGTGVRLYVYPGLDAATGRRIELDTLEIPRSVQPLIAYLRERGFVEPIEGLADEALRLKSDEVLAKLRRREADWKDWIEPDVAEAIESQGLFGFGRPARIPA